MASTQSHIPALTFTGSIHEGIPVDTKNLEACITFCIEVLGLKLLPRPKALDQFGPGAWLADSDDTIQFHLIANDGALKPSEDAKVEPAGRHTAWRITDVAAFRERMRALDVPFQEIAGLIGDAQLFVTDPQGHTWEFQGPSGSGS